jgi:hypothetical protein
MLPFQVIKSRAILLPVHTLDILAGLFWFRILKMGILKWKNGPLQGNLPTKNNTG